MPLLTLAALSQMVYHRIEENTVFYPAQEVTDAINEALRIANLFSGFYQGRVALPALSTANRIIYDHPAGVLYPTDVYFEEVALTKASVSSASRDYPNWLQGVSGSGPGFWVPIGLTKFAIVPYDQYGGRFMETAGILEPVPLVNPGDQATLPDEWVDLTAEYAYITLALDEGGKVFADAARNFPQVLSKLKELSRWRDFRWPLKQNAARSSR